MTKTRTLLGLLVLGLSLGGAIIWGSDLKFDLKVILIAVDSLFWLAACLILALDIFSLDDHGRIAHGSLGWKFLSLFFGGSSMPGQLKICPMYWFVVLYLFLTTAVLAAVSVLSVVFYIFISGFLTGEVSGIAFLIFIAIAIWFILLIFSLTKAEKEKGKYKFVFPVLLAMPVLGVVFSFVYQAYLGGMTLSSAIIAVLIKIIFSIGIIAGGLLVLTLAASLLVIIFIYIGHFFGGMKNSLVGQLASATYKKLCPVIPIQRAPENDEDAIQRWDYSG